MLQTNQLMMKCQVKQQHEDGRRLRKTTWGRLFSFSLTLWPFLTPIPPLLHSFLRFIFVPFLDCLFYSFLNFPFFHSLSLSSSLSSSLFLLLPSFFFLISTWFSSFLACSFPCFLHFGLLPFFFTYSHRFSLFFFILFYFSPTRISIWLFSVLPSLPLYCFILSVTLSISHLLMQRNLSPSSTTLRGTVGILNDPYLPPPIRILSSK